VLLTETLTLTESPTLILSFDKLKFPYLNVVYDKPYPKLYNGFPVKYRYVRSAKYQLINLFIIKYLKILLFKEKI
jgi:hypothetical protein